MQPNTYSNPEPVPAASQLAVLPFLAALDAMLRTDAPVVGLRTTIHRIMSREGDGYLQQVCPYLCDSGVQWRRKVGRIFPANYGIVGKASETGQIWRTKRFSTLESFRSRMQQAILEAEEDRPIDEVPISYLAVPFRGPTNQVVLILYAECFSFNFFADDERIRRIAEISQGLCRLFDWLQDEPFPHLRNFSLPAGVPIIGHQRMYVGVHEPIDTIKAPEFTRVEAFNYEASAA